MIDIMDSLGECNGVKYQLLVFFLLLQPSYNNWYTFHYITYERLLIGFEVLRHTWTYLEPWCAKRFILKKLTNRNYPLWHFNWERAQAHTLRNTWLEHRWQAWCTWALTTSQLVHAQFPFSQDTCTSVVFGCSFSGSHFADLNLLLLIWLCTFCWIWVTARAILSLPLSKNYLGNFIKFFSHHMYAWIYRKSSIGYSLRFKISVAIFSEYKCIYN
jgi:hypothetical protein